MLGHACSDLFYKHRFVLHPTYQIMLNLNVIKGMSTLTLKFLWLSILNDHIWFWSLFDHTLNDDIEIYLLEFISIRLYASILFYFIFCPSNSDFVLKVLK